jgi:predicted outer membrane repeat protein
VFLLYVFYFFIYLYFSSFSFFFFFFFIWVNGGGCYFTYCPVINIYNGYFYNCTCVTPQVTGNGGVLFFGLNANFVIENSTFENNTANYGGAIFSMVCDLFIYYIVYICIYFFFFFYLYIYVFGCIIWLFVIVNINIIHCACLSSLNYLDFGQLSDVNFWWTME